jgi:lipase chaperone LimK
MPTEMKKITLKQGLIGSIALSSFCFIIYQATLNQKDLPQLSEPSNLNEVSIVVEQEPANKANNANTSSLSIKAPIESDDSIAYQTPKTFPNGPFAPSIENTEIDGSLKADASGKLIIDIETRDLFDYFMNTVADVPPEVAIAELEKLARASLPESAVNQVMALLGDYLLYKETAIEYSSQPLLPADQQDENYQLSILETSFATLKDIRRSTMSEDAVEAFFGLEEAYGEFTLVSIKIQKDPNLTPEQMQIELQVQRELLPEVIRNTETRMVEDIQNSQEVNKLLLSDQRDSEIESQLREKGLSDEAVNEALDYRKQQRDFEDQYSLYQKERNQLLSAGLSEDDMLIQKERLLQKYFQSEQTQTQAKVKDLSS